MARPRPIPVVERFKKRKFAENRASAGRSRRNAFGRMYEFSNDTRADLAPSDHDGVDEILARLLPGNVWNAPPPISSTAWSSVKELTKLFTPSLASKCLYESLVISQRFLHRRSTFSRRLTPTAEARVLSPSWCRRCSHFRIRCSVACLQNVVIPHAR